MHPRQSKLEIDAETEISYPSGQVQRAFRPDEGLVALAKLVELRHGKCVLEDRSCAVVGGAIEGFARPCEHLASLPNRCSQAPAKLQNPICGLEREMVRIRSGLVRQKFTDPLPTSQLLLDIALAHPLGAARLPARRGNTISCLFPVMGE